MTSDDWRRGLGTRVQLSERRSRLPIRPIRPVARHVSAAAFSQEISVRSRQLVPANAGPAAAAFKARTLGAPQPQGYSTRKCPRSHANRRRWLAHVPGATSQGACFLRFPPFASFPRRRPKRVAPPGRFRSSSPAKEPVWVNATDRRAAPPAANSGGQGT
jgi:hypothetical protein